MKFSDIKFGLYSLLTGFASLLVYSFNNYEAYKLYIEVYYDLTISSGDLNASLISGVTKYPLIFSTAGLIFGILALVNKSKFRIPGIIISIIAVILSFFPVWMKFI